MTDGSAVIARLVIVPKVLVLVVVTLLGVCWEIVSRVGCGGVAPTYRDRLRLDIRGRNGFGVCDAFRDDIYLRGLDNRRCRAGYRDCRR
jgi:hypothetical protein